MKKDKLKEKHKWVMETIKEFGFPWFTWVWKDFGRQFTCEFGWPDRDIHTGIILEGLGINPFVFEQTKENEIKLKEYAENILRFNPVRSKK